MPVTYKKLWEEEQKMLDQWFDITRNMYEPVLKSDKASQPKEAGKSETKAFDGNWILEAYSNWFSTLYDFWKSNTSFYKGFGFDPEATGHFFSSDANRRNIEKFLEVYPADQWSMLFEQSNQLLERYIDFLKEIDLPFDEIASFWDKWLAQFTPLDDVPLFRLGSNIHQHLEVMVNPFYSIMGTPKLLKVMRLLRDIQFYYLSFLIKNAELRSTLLESSLAVLPETIKVLGEEYDKSKEMPSFSDFIQQYLSMQENYLQEILESEEYSAIQNSTAETGIKLKSKLDELIELSISGWPVMTRSDQDEIAKEMESIRNKLRQIQNKKGVKAEKTQAI